MADPEGRIFDLEGYGAVGAANGRLHVLAHEHTIDMPHGSELMMLPHRRPVVYNFGLNRFEILDHNPYDPGEKIFPVAVFNSPGYLNRFCCAYDDTGIDSLLPLFSYGAAGFSKGGFKSAAICVDDEPRQDLRQMPRKKVVKGVGRMRRKYPDNRLIRHIENCALTYGCPAGKNFFLKRYEAPLPTARNCNASCLGCISLQTDTGLSACQNRISFTPSSEEIAQLALEHIENVDRAVVSFGQGCEGDPLTAVRVIEPAIRQIRETTDKGTINMNTNAGLSRAVDRLCRAGLDTIRVSMNSVQKPFYNAYFRPISYVFEDVLESIDTARSHGKFVAVNYLNCPGFTDSETEINALHSFIRAHDINMIQWRNLNYDPNAYCRYMSSVSDPGSPRGMETILKSLEREFPAIIHGYFNPPKDTYGR